MKILLIYPDVLPAFRTYKGYFNQGVASIAAVLEKAGHQVKLLHLISPPERSEIVHCVTAFNPGIVGISSTTNQFELAKLVAEWVKQALPSAIIVSGGIHSMLNSDQVIEQPEFDMVCRGEGEIPMLHLAEKLEQGADWENTPNMWIRLKDGTIRRNQILPPIDNLDDLPWPSRDIWNYPELQMESGGYASVMFSRGCPNRCTYCCNLAISKIYREGGTKKYFRSRSVDSAIAELAWLKKRYSFVKAFNFDDDNLFLDIQWAREFSKRYREEIGLPFTCNLYPGLINKERVDLLKNAGCMDLRIGLESGNEKVRSELLGRNISDEAMRNAYRLCRESGINTRSFVMVGLPGETADMILDTIQFVAEERVGIAHISIFFPYRGTELYDYSVAKGFLICEDTTKDYYSNSTLDMELSRKNQIRMFRTYFPVFVLIFRFVNFLPCSVRPTANNLVRKFLKAKWLPNLLNPISWSLRVAKKLFPRGMNLLQIQFDAKQASLDSVNDIKTNKAGK